jgi:UDP-galactopyranose mutase
MQEQQRFFASQIGQLSEFETKFLNKSSKKAMQKEYDYLIVGSGLTGAVIARKLTDQGFSVLVLDRREHLGGNVYDETHESGIRIHTYGPHYFRTSSDEIWSFVNRFSEFFDYQPELKTIVDQKAEDWPVSSEYMERTIGKDWKPTFIGEPKNFEEASLAMMPQEIYEKFIYGYSKKQWGVEPAELEANLAGRFDVRMNGDKRLKNSKFQGIPKHGYASFMKQMLSGIETKTDYKYHPSTCEISVRYKTIYTGPIDELFDYALGKLEYRGQIRKHSWIPDTQYIQPCGQINNPSIDAGDHVRTLEWKHMMPAEQVSSIEGTVVTTETPFTPTESNECEYPFPSTKNQKLYQRYRALAESVPSLLVCGRLGEYKYYDMDQAIGRAMMLSDKLIAERVVAPLVETTTKTLSLAQQIEKVVSAVVSENETVALHHP